MPRFLTFVFAFIMANLLQAQVTIQPNSDGSATLSVLQSTEQSTTLHYSFAEFSLNEMTAGTELYHSIGLGNTAPLMEAGAPEVRITAGSLIIPDNGRMGIEIITANYQEFANINLIPSKGNLYRDINPSDIPLVKGSHYTTDKFYPGELATLRDPYIMRDFRGQTVVFQPFQYNPVTRTLRVYHDITLKVSKEVQGGLNTFDRGSKPATIAEEFHQIYNRHFLNFEALGLNYIPVSEEGKMLVISYGTFIPEMNDFVSWKNAKGIPCEMVNVSTIGTTASSIKTYVTNYYNTQGLTYLLLVGDAAQIPTNSLTSGHSDNAYAYILGNDHYPEFFVGRFSAENLTHVETQVLRTLSYEMNPDTTGGWLKKSIGIATLEGPGDDNELDYVHVRNMQLDLLGYTYTGNLEFFEGSQGGNDAPGNPTATMVQNAVDDGAGIILYTGHGSNTSWGTSGFSNTNVGNLSNYNRWPFIWSVACVNGNFVSTTCFGEAWLRALKSDQPTGAIAILASTINQSWNPPMEGQDEMVDILVESYPTNIKRTFGGLSMHGCMKMNDTYGGAGDEMTDTWTIFGDPSIQVFTTTPTPIAASHQPVAMIGATQFPIFCQTNGAKATLSKNGQILGTGLVAGSTVTINYTSPLAPDTLLLVITAFNKIPYIAEIPLIVSNAPYVTYKGHQVSDQGSNNNQRADYGESVNLNVSLENIGVLTASSVNAILRSLDPQVTVNDSTATFGNIPDGATLQVSNAFSISLSDSVPDGHLASMQLIISDNSSNQWISNFTILCHAPNLVIDTIFFNDLAGGNGNGKLEPGEVAVVNVVVRNAGGAEADQHFCRISTQSVFAELFGKDSLSIAQLPVQTPVNLQYYARLDTATTVGAVFTYDIHFQTGYYKANRSISDKIMHADEDWETGNFQKFNWQHTGNSNWTITNSLPYQGTYSARSGVIGNNAYSALSVDWFSAFPDTISFWLKVSCENGSASGQKWDFLEFYIDGVAQAWWDGNKSWMKVSYPVSSGQHTFTWRYQKDGYATGGSDAAWIDMISFPAAGGEVTLKPFVLMEYAHFNDAVSGDNNGHINAGETIDISYKLSNIGYRDAINTNGMISVNDPLVTLVNPQGAFGTLVAGNSLLTGDVMKVQISPAATSGQTFQYDLTLTDDSANTWLFPFLMIVDAATSVEELLVKPGMVLYPNPFNEMFSIRLTNAKPQASASVAIFTLDGRLVKEVMVNSLTEDGMITLPSSGLPSGALLIRVILDDAVITVKGVKH
ncbi:MAG: C25 family cysteine peptidase [Bacteroidales bacterium]